MVNDFLFNFRMNLGGRKNTMKLLRRFEYQVTLAYLLVGLL